MGRDVLDLTWEVLKHYATEFGVVAALVVLALLAKFGAWVLTRVFSKHRVSGQWETQLDRGSGLQKHEDAVLNQFIHHVWGTLGIIEMLTSEQLRRFGESITGRTLQPDPGVQIICYDAGDFSGPHNDHHPEDRHLRDGYVDIHIALSEPAVKSQWLVYEGSPGLLNAVAEVGHGCMVSVYQLPFWHYTTPLVPVRKGVGARRWVLMASYVQ